MKIFLGGTCNGSSWREYMEELLDYAGIDYFNPVVSDWDEAARREELLQRESCDLVLYTITPKMVGVYSVAEAVDDSNKRPEKTILLILPRDGSRIFTDHQLKSMNSLAELVRRNGATVETTLEGVVEHIKERMYA